MKVKVGRPAIVWRHEAVICRGARRRAERRPPLRSGPADGGISIRSAGAAVSRPKGAIATRLAPWRPSGRQCWTHPIAAPGDAETVGRRSIPDGHWRRALRTVTAP